MTEYVDIREIRPDYYELECWNCGHTRLVKRQPAMCHECFMGQRGVDHETQYTVNGYVDYRSLWYGDVSLEEAKQRYEEKTRDTRERLQQHDASKRTVIL